MALCSFFLSFFLIPKSFSIKLELQESERERRGTNPLPRPMKQLLMSANKQSLRFSFRTLLSSRANKREKSATRNARLLSTVKPIIFFTSLFRYPSPFVFTRSQNLPALDFHLENLFLNHRYRRNEWWWWTIQHTITCKSFNWAIPIRPWCMRCSNKPIRKHRENSKTSSPYVLLMQGKVSYRFLPLQPSACAHRLSSR